MSAYKDDRYSGLLGAGRWLRDKVMGMPDAVNAFYEEGRKNYLAAMEAVIDKVATIVETDLNAATARIAAGRDEMRTYVNGLPQDLQKVGAEAARNVQDKFEELKHDVEAKGEALVDTVAQKYRSARDALDSRIEEMKAANRGIVDKALDAVVGVIKTILALKDMLLGVLAKAAGVIEDIISDPIGFLGNLISGIKAGLDKFIGNIWEHLKSALMGWLFGALGSAGLKIPDKLDLKGILDIVLQVMGLTYQHLRERAVKIVGPDVVDRLESVVDVFKTIVTEGPAGLWKWVSEKLSNLEDLVLGPIKEFLVEKVIKAGITWLISILNPAAAFIKACKLIYDVVMFFVERGKQIMEFVNSILDSAAAIAKGSLGVVADAIDRSLGNLLPLAISFLADLIGLGGISEKIKSIIDVVRSPVDKAIDAIVGGAARAFMATFGKGIAWAKGNVEAGKEWAKEKVEAGKEWAKEKAGAIKDRLTGGATEHDAGAQGADPRDEAQKQAAVDGALRDAEAVMDRPGATAESTEEALPAIKARHNLTVLQVVGSDEGFHVHAELNPKGDTKIAGTSWKLAEGGIVGNEGRVLTDADGNPIIARDGQPLRCPHRCPSRHDYPRGGCKPCQRQSCARDRVP